MTTTLTVRDPVGTDWDRALLDVADAFAMDEEERIRFCAKPVARLIAAIPYLAGCERPRRTAIEHLGVYVLSVRATRSAFFASPEDDHDVLARLDPIMRFRGGNRQIVDRGMAVLGLNMIVDYDRDRRVDSVLGKYNPIGSGAWDGEALAEQFRRRIAEVDCPQMDEIMNSDEGSDDWWTWA